MNYIYLTDNSIFNSNNSLFIESAHDVQDIAGIINSLQKFLSACIDGHKRKMVDMNTVVTFLTDFCDCKVVDSDYAIDCALEAGQYTLLNDFEAQFLEVDIAKAAVGIA